MKKIFSIISVVALAFSIVACSDDDDEGAAYNRASTISVVSSHVLFSAKAETGNVVIKSQGPISLSETSEWCKATVVGDTLVQVAVDNNENINGRSCVLTIKSGVDSTNVTVQQQGFVFQSGVGTTLVSNDLAYKKSFSLNCNGAPTIFSTNDWLSVTAENDSLVVSMEANDTGHLRQGYIKYTYGELKDSILVTQYDFAKDIAGQYYLAFTQTNGKVGAFRSELRKSGAGYLLSLPQLGMDLPVTFDEKTCKISISAGSYMGPFTYSGTAYQMYTVLGSSTEGYLTWDTSVTYPAAFQYDEENGTYAMFEDNGSWGSYPVDYLALSLFVDRSMEDDSYAGTLYYLIDPYLLKMDSSAPAKKKFGTPLKVLK